MRATFDTYVNKGVPFCLAIGDIDFFKKVNDTYGHEAGDAVLVRVSFILKQFMLGKGYAIRWGGEEFLLIFEDCQIETAYKNMHDLLDIIRAQVIEHGENYISVTMTFGVMDCKDTGDDEAGEAAWEVIKAGRPDDPKGIEMYDAAVGSRIDKYISDADKKLYFGKENGRNQIVH